MTPVVIPSEVEGSVPAARTARQFSLFGSSRRSGVSVVRESASFGSSRR
jgi:hypothetical protein